MEPLCSGSIPLSSVSSFSTRIEVQQESATKLSDHEELTLISSSFSRYYWLLRTFQNSNEWMDQLVTGLAQMKSEYSCLCLRPQYIAKKRLKKKKPFLSEAIQQQGHSSRTLLWSSLEGVSICLTICLSQTHRSYSATSSRTTTRIVLPTCLETYHCQEMPTP